MAHNDAHTYLELGSDYLKPYKQSHLHRFEEWFGVYSPVNYEYVRENMIETYKETAAPHVYNFLPASMCRKSWMAHVDTVLLGKKQHVINLCPGFFAPTLKTSNRALILAREMVKDTSSTQDKRVKGFDCSGAATCKQLATNKPNLAVECAQSYALFAYDVYLATKSGTGVRRKSRITSESDKSGELYRLLHKFSIQQY